MNNRSAFEKYKIEIPQKDICEFDQQDMVKILTYKVGIEIPRVLKELDVYINKDKQFTARKANLLLNGKNDKRSSHRMKNYVGEYIDFFKDIQINLQDALEDILEEIISDMIKYDKNFTRKKMFNNTIETLTGQTFLFIIGVISIGEYLIKKYGYIQNGRYLEQVLIARKELASKIKRVYKDMNKGIYSEEEARELFKELIKKKVQDNIKLNVEMYEEIKFENDLYDMCKEESITDVIYNIVDGARQKITGQMRLIDL